jgi:hypothetical protein
MKLGDRILILLVAAVALVSYLLWRPGSSAAGTVAEIRIDSVVRETIDLSAVAEPYTKTLYTGDGGYNVIEIRTGMIRVLEANCPEQVDVRQGWISRPSESIVCVPHRLVITLVTRHGQREDVDGVSY